MASMAFLLLGAAVSFVASVDPTLQLEALTQKARRMQELTLVPLPAGCASACPDFQSAYDEMECLASKGAEEYLKVLKRDRTDRSFLGLNEKAFSGNMSCHGTLLLYVSSCHDNWIYQLHSPFLGKAFLQKPWPSMA